MIVVLDTNVIVAAMVVAKGLCYEVLVRAPGSSMVAASQPLLDELEHTLRTKFTLGLAGKAFLEQLRLRVRIVEPPPLRAPVCRDADDDVVLATAVGAEASLIVTGDQDLLVIDRHNGIDIISPRDFLRCWFNNLLGGRTRHLGWESNRRSRDKTRPD